MPFQVGRLSSPGGGLLTPNSRPHVSGIDELTPRPPPMPVLVPAGVCRAGLWLGQENRAGEGRPCGALGLPAGGFQGDGG